MLPSVEMMTEILQIKGVLAALILACGGSLWKLHQRLSQLENSEMSAIKKEISELNHKFDLGIQKLTLWLESVRSKE